MFKRIVCVVSMTVLPIIFVMPSLVYAKVKGDVVSVELNFTEPIITPSNIVADPSTQNNPTTVTPYSHVEITGLPSLGNVGEPVLPVKGVNILIPAGKKVVGVKIIPGEKIVIPGTYFIEPGQQVYPLSKLDTTKIKIDKPNPEIYQSIKAFPENKYIHHGLQNKTGYDLEIFSVYPVEYNPQQQEISYYKTMTVEVQLDSLKAKRAKTEPKFRDNEQDKENIKRLIDNKVDLDEYNLVAALSLTTQSTGTLPSVSSEATLTGGTAINAVAPANYPYVIITSSSFSSAFEPLIQRRTQRGLPATIVTTDWIYANYSGTRPDGGTDNQTKIRNFIIDAYNNWNTRYVLLGGDADGATVGGESGNDIVPIRQLWHTMANGVEYIASDLYYACLNGDFDYDRDGKYGETTDGVGGADIDLLAEVYVGRAPVDSVTEATNFVNKTLAYEDSTDEYLGTALMVGEYMGGFGVPYASRYMEEIRLGTSNYGFTTQGFLSNINKAVDTRTLYDAPPPDFFSFAPPGYVWNKSELISIINNGVHLINHLGHSNNTYNMKMQNADADALTNTKNFICYTQGCYPGAVDNRDLSNNYIADDSIVEHFMGSSKGAVGFIANTRNGYYSPTGTDGPSQYYARHFWDAFYSENISELGKMNQDSKEDNVPYLSYPQQRWCYFTITLFGDPALNIHIPLIPFTDIKDPTYSESIGDMDGIFEPNETMNMIVPLQGLNGDMTNVVATLSSSTPGVVISQATANYGAILKGQTISNTSAPFKFYIPPSDAFNIDLTLTITATGYTTSKKFSFAPAKERRLTTNTSDQNSPSAWGAYVVYSDRRNGNFDIYMNNIITGEETQITSNTALQLAPTIYDNYIVYTDTRNGNDDIYMYTISSKTEKRITTNTANQSLPVINGDKIVYQDNRNGNWDIYMYTISTGAETRITTNTAHQYKPVIYGDRIVYEDYRNGNYDIYMYTISTGVETRITTNTSAQDSPVIYGDRIVFTDWQTGNPDIYMYSISTGTETPITSGSAWQYHPAIFDNYIVYTEEDPDYVGNLEIYLYTISTGTLQRITKNAARSDNAAVYGNYIVYEDNRWGNYDIYMSTISVGTETQITTKTTSDYRPKIYGNYIVYEDQRNGNLDIYMKNLSTGVETQITTKTTHQSNAAVYGDNIVYQDWDAYVLYGDIYMYTISTGVTRQITSSAASQTSSAIYSDRIVYQDRRNNNWDLYMYTISTGVETRITTNTTDQISPRIYGNYIVYTDYRNGNAEIYMYTISTGVEIRITTNTATQGAPVIYGDNIVYHDYRNGNWDIYMYTISTGVEKRITTNTAHQTTPAVYGDRIVYHDNRNGNYDIYMYTISTGTETRITTNTALQYNPDIYGNLIVYEDKRNGNYDIYMMPIQ